MTPVPYLDLKPQYKALEGAINARIQTVLNHGQFILGPEMVEAERDLAAYIGTKHCLAVSSGTDASIMALMALGVGPGDEVITTPFSFFATAEVISLVGAKPVFVDIEDTAYNLDATKIEAAITSKTKVIMPVSLYGQPADYDEINAIGEKHGLTVIEDAAQSFGAPYKGKKSCALTRVGTTSFFPAKPLGCYGDGGAVFTNDTELNKKMEMIRVHGQASRYNHVMMGINGRLDTLQCAVLIEKLKRFDWEIEQRVRIARMYNEGLSSLGSRCVVPRMRPDRGSVWAQYTILVENRDAFAAAVKKHGVPTSIHYPSLLPHQPIYRELGFKGSWPVAERASSRCISLPMWPDMTDAQVKQVIDGVRAVVGS